MTTIDPANIVIADDVAATIGPELITRLKSEIRLYDYPCRECNQPLNPATQQIAVLISIANDDIGDIHRLQLTHSPCRPSGIYPASPDEAPPELDADDTLTALATMWPPTMINPRPILLISLKVEGLTVAESGDSVDLNTMVLAQGGWTIAAPLGQPTMTTPENTETRCNITGYDHQFAYGRLLITGPMGSKGIGLIADLDLTFPIPWIVSADLAKHIDAYVGPFDIHNWTPGELSYRDITRAIRSGRTAAAHIPTTISTPT